MCQREPLRAEKLGRMRVLPTVRDRLRMLLFFTPWVSIPLALLGAALTICFPLTLIVNVGWVVYGIAVLCAIALGLWLRPRYRVSILDSSPLGVFGWLRRRY